MLSSTPKGHQRLLNLHSWRNHYHLGGGTAVRASMQTSSGLSAADVLISYLLKKTELKERASITSPSWLDNQSCAKKYETVRTILRRGGKASMEFGEHVLMGGSSSSKRLLVPTRKSFLKGGGGRTAAKGESSHFFSQAATVDGRRGENRSRTGGRRVSTRGDPLRVTVCSPNSMRKAID